MPYTFLADDLETVTFTVSGVGVTDCTRLGWADTEGAVTVSFLETLSSCNADDVAIVDWLTDITSDGAEVFVTPGGLLLADPSSTLQLVRPPVVEVDPDGVTLAAGAMYGIEPGTGVSPDDVLDVVVPRLGPPDLDTGWVVAGDLPSETMNPVFDPCSDVTGDSRESWWGDLSFGFGGSGSRTDLQFWNVGDRRLRFGPDTPGTPPTITTGLTTEAGIGVGSAAASIPDDVATASNRNVGQADRFDGGVGVWVTSVVSANPEFTPAVWPHPSARASTSWPTASSWRSAPAPWVAERPTPERAMSERTTYGHVAHRRGWARAGRTSADVSGRTR